MKGRILLVEDDPNARYALEMVLRQEGYEVEAVEESPGCENLEGYDLLILDLKLKNLSGVDFLKKIREEGKSIPVVVITAYANPENVISVSRYGAIDILKKPFDKEEILGLVNRLLREDRPAPQDTDYQGDIVGASREMMEVFKKVGLAASTEMNVLLMGETGVGKDLLAKVIHEKSARGEGPFVSVNCSAIPENLLEAELFGYRKGAFTGAVRDTKGKIKLAEGGTLFLDEIGDLPLSLQAKLLRFLENRSFYRLGDEKERKANVRIVAATNRDLGRMIKEGLFREDLYYRLSQIVIEIPPLRKRKEDIPPLIDLFIKKANEELGTRVMGISEKALKEAVTYDWKGNVRELKNAVYKAVIETKEGYIERLVPCEEERRDVEALMLECIEKTPEEELKNLVPTFERKVIQYLMKKYSGNKSKVAQVLGVSRNTLRVKLEKDS